MQSLYSQNTPYTMGCLFEDFRENWTRYNGTTHNDDDNDNDNNDNSDDNDNDKTRKEGKVAG